MEEHRVIERVLEALGRMIEEEVVDSAFLREALDFFRNFADGCHHAKEEEALFPALESAGVPRDGGPIGCMLHEHDEGRMLLRTIETNLAAAESGNVSARGTVLRAAQRYMVMLRQHIQKEDSVLFVIAENVLSPAQKAEVLRDFAIKEREPLREGQRAHYLTLADRLAAWCFSNSTARWPTA